MFHYSSKDTAEIRIALNEAERQRLRGARRTCLQLSRFYGCRGAIPASFSGQGSHVGAKLWTPPWTLGKADSGLRRRAEDRATAKEPARVARPRENDSCMQPAAASGAPRTHLRLRSHPTASRLRTRNAAAFDISICYFNVANTLLFNFQSRKKNIISIPLPSSPSGRLVSVI
jgi:hypothetical protein